MTKIDDFDRQVKLWNSLSAESKKAFSLGGFKKSIQG